jgi:adenine-specific DNA-methyltransferase
LFPELVTEGPNGPAVNLDVLKALVGDATVTDTFAPTQPRRG